MEGTYIIYCYTNKLTGKKYVGQTCRTLEERAGKDGCNYARNCNVFGSAIQKYGWESFVGEIIEDGLTMKQANEREQYWISKLNTISPNGYNLQPGGDNHKVHEFTRKKISTSLMGEKNPNFGKHQSEEWRTKISEANKGEKAFWFGKKFTEDVCKKMSESRMGHSVSDETKSRISLAKKGKNNNPFSSKRVHQFTKDGQFIAEFLSQEEATRQTGIHHISECCLGKRRTAGGYIWKQVA